MRSYGTFAEMNGMVRAWCARMSSDSTLLEAWLRQSWAQWASSGALLPSVPLLTAPTLCTSPAAPLQDEGHAAAAGGAGAPDGAHFRPRRGARPAQRMHFGRLQVRSGLRARWWGLVGLQGAWQVGGVWLVRVGPVRAVLAATCPLAALPPG